MAKAIFNFVPTPSTLLTSTGSRIPEKFGAKQAAEAADFAEHLRAVRLPNESVDSAFQAVAEIDVDAGAGVGFFRLCRS